MSQQTAQSNTSSQAASAQRPIWWEKTVEYKFVLHHLQEAADVAPLGGHLVEPAEGDLRLMLEGKIALIEFKKDVRSIAAEARKYADGPARYPVGAGGSLTGMPALIAMRTVAATMAGTPSSNGEADTLATALAVLDGMAAAPGHHLIYGDFVNGSLSLKRQQYSKASWRKAQQGTASAVPGPPLACVPGDDMVEYLKVLAELRGRPASVGSDGFVVAISKDGNGKQVYPLSIVLQTVLPTAAAAQDVPASRSNTSNRKPRP